MWHCVRKFIYFQLLNVENKVRRAEHGYNIGKKYKFVRGSTESVSYHILGLYSVIL